jgi:hypothetical protein
MQQERTNLMRYSVLIKRVINIRTDFIEAESQTEAIAKAEEMLSFHELTPNQQNPAPGVQYIEDAEETAYFLVDEEDDDWCDESHWYAADGKTLCEGDACSMCGKTPRKPRQSQSKKTELLDRINAANKTLGVSGESFSQLARRSNAALKLLAEASEARAKEARDDDPIM